MEVSEADRAEAALSARIFIEQPACALCGSDNVRHFLTVYDSSNLVQCQKCSLVYTSPRLEEPLWQAFLKNEDNKRNKEFTENRIKTGVALKKNISNQPPNWRTRITRKNGRVLEELRSAIRRPFESLHDVGCGVGFLLADAEAEGIHASGNDLNGYACSVMRERLGLDVHCGAINEIGLKDESRDAVTMTDYIEHTYHPARDLAEAHRIIRPGGVIYVHTFRIDSRAFEKKREKWSMLAWNHVYHFSTQTLSKMVEAAGFHLERVVSPSYDASIAITASKPS